MQNEYADIPLGKATEKPDWLSFTHELPRRKEVLGAEVTRSLLIANKQEIALACLRRSFCLFQYMKVHC